MNLPRSLLFAPCSGRIRGVPEDFIVEEIPAFEASGEGEHLLLTLQKRGMNTVFCAETIARWAGVDAREVSFAGMKDRHALTTQRFSVRLPKKTSPDVNLLNSDDVQCNGSCLAQSKAGAWRFGRQPIYSDAARVVRWP